MIIRIDSERGTHGWQVRISHTKHSKLFSDRKYGDSEGAKMAARDYETDYLKLHPSPFKSGNSARTSRRTDNTSGVNGVHYSYVRWHKKEEKHYFWGASFINDEGSPRTRRFYVETHGFDKAKTLAIEFRQTWEAGQLAENKTPK